MTEKLPTLMQVKTQAKRLRAERAESGAPMGHGKSLEVIAHRYGFRDWNTMSAALSQAGAGRFAIGDRVSGTYLAQPFTAQVLAVADEANGWTRLELQFDAPVDVVTSERFSNLRRRVRGTIGPKGHSKERTSDGQPHLVIDP